MTDNRNTARRPHIHVRTRNVATLTWSTLSVHRRPPSPASGVPAQPHPHQPSCARISCCCHTNQALRLLLVLSMADDSQKAALRTPRVLHAALAFFTPDSMGSSSGNNSSDSSSSSGTNSNGNDRKSGASVDNAQPLEAMSAAVAEGSQQQQAQMMKMHTSATVSEAGRGSYPNPLPSATFKRGPDHEATAHELLATTAAALTTTRASPPVAAADVTARLLLTELLPPQFSESNDDITAALKALPPAYAGAVATAATLAGAGASTGEGGMDGGTTGASSTQAPRWTGRAGGRGRARHATASGAWCSGLDFDRAAGGSRRPGGE